MLVNPVNLDLHLVEMIDFLGFMKRITTVNQYDQIVLHQSASVLWVSHIDEVVLPKGWTSCYLVRAVFRFWWKWIENHLSHIAHWRLWKRGIDPLGYLLIMKYTYHETQCHKPWFGYLHLLGIPWSILKSIHVNPRFFEDVEILMFYQNPFSLPQC